MGGTPLGSISGTQAIDSDSVGMLIDAYSAPASISGASQPVQIQMSYFEQHTDPSGYLYYQFGRVYAAATITVVASGRRGVRVSHLVATNCSNCGRTISYSVARTCSISTCTSSL